MNTDNLTPHEQKQIVIHQLRMERLRLAFTANLYDYRVAISEHTRQASARRKEIDAIIEKLSAALNLSNWNCSPPLAKSDSKKGKPCN